MLVNIIEFKAIMIKPATYDNKRVGSIYDCIIEDGIYKFKNDDIEDTDYLYDFWIDGNKLFLEHFQILPSSLHLFREEIQYEIC